MVTRRASTLRTRPGAAPAFALVEVIAAGILLGVSLAVIIGLTGQAMFAQAHSQDLESAAMLADERLALVLACGPEDYGRRFATEGPCDAPFERFRYRVEIRAGAAMDPYTVRATITWGGDSSWVGAGRSRSLTVETMIAPRQGDDPDPDRRPPTPVNRFQ